MSSAIHEAVIRILPDITLLRHELHQHPELRFEEQWTANRVAQFLESAGISYSRGHAKGTGVVAVVAGKGSRGVALRADLDALQVTEDTGLPYASAIPGRMHACGHDGHTAVLCGVAKILQEHRNLLHGAVKLIFQPAEEQGAGGRCIVEEGLLDSVGAAFALHAWPEIPVGKLAVHRGQVMASADFFRIDVFGHGGHGAHPAQTIDPVLVAAHIITALQTIVSREVDPLEPAVVTIGRIHAGDAANVIPGHAWMEGTFRALNPEVRNYIARAIERLAHGVAAAFRARAKVTPLDVAYPPLINDPAMSDFAQGIVKDVLGDHALIELPHPYMVAEDFAFCLERAPGAFLFLGTRPGDQPNYPGLHSPRFDFNDDALPVAMEVMANLALRFLSII